MFASVSVYAYGFICRNSLVLSEFQYTQCTHSISLDIDGGSLEFQGNNVIGRASILKTPMGQIVEGLLEGGVKLGVSSRGMGTLENRQSGMYVRSDFLLASIDIVQDPSAPSAFVNGVMEGVDWVWNNGILEAREIEIIETEIKRAPLKALPETEIRAFKHFLSKL